jgi:Glycosyl transferase family 2
MAQALRTGGVRGLASLLRRRFAEDDRVRALRRSTRRVVEFGIRPHLLHGRIRHVQGPTEIAYGPHELLVITVVRNGALHIESFMQHYNALGVAHCVFLDNGSTDGTIDRLCAHRGVTVLQTDAPYSSFENTMKRYLAERFSRGRWNLCADIDELFDYPFSSELTLNDFLGYLNLRGFTAVVCQMLDLFSEVPFGTLDSTPDDHLKHKYAWYDISDVDRREYEWSTLSSTAIKMHWGGIRRAVFGTSNALTKAALVRMDGRVKPFVQWHHATGAVLADISCVLMHYPFVSTFRDKVADAVRTGRYGTTTTDEYRAYARALTRDPTLSLKRASACRFTSLDPLIRDGFLVVSDEYRQWLTAHRSRTSPPRMG